jgi:GMP synthase (glutamine-hydrolysing)
MSFCCKEEEVMHEESHELVLVIDFGAQYSQLIARRVRECNVYCEIVPYSCSLDKIKAKKPAALILSGGPASVYADKAPKADAGIFTLGIPVLGICYGHQFMAQTLGGKVQSADVREYGKTSVVLQTNS